MTQTVDGYVRSCTHPPASLAQVACSPTRTYLFRRRKHELAVREQVLELALRHAGGGVAAVTATEVLEQVIEREEVLQEQPLHRINLPRVIG